MEREESCTENCTGFLFLLLSDFKYKMQVRIAQERLASNAIS